MIDKLIPAVIVSIALVAAAFFLGGRYSVAGTQGAAFVVDRFTGATWSCAANACRRVNYSG